jgi:hypothetical protein
MTPGPPGDFALLIFWCPRALCTGHKRNRHRSVLSKCPTRSSSRSDGGATMTERMLKVAASSALSLDLILADRFSRSEGIELDTTGGAAAFLPADQFPELQDDSLANLHSEGCVIIAWLHGRSAILAPIRISGMRHWATTERSLRFAWAQRMRPDLNDAVDPADIARVATYPVDIKTIRLNLEAW